jgi:hypothetical protein
VLINWNTNFLLSVTNSNGFVCIRDNQNIEGETPLFHKVLKLGRHRCSFSSTAPEYQTVVCPCRAAALLIIQRKRLIN